MYDNFTTSMKSDLVVSLSNSLLDSSLITSHPTTNKRIYNAKIIKCGDYIEYYNYNGIKSNIDKNLELVYKKRKLDFSYEDDIDIESMSDDEFNLLLDNKKREKHKSCLKTIEYKNILRSRFELHRLVKTNIKDFITFITLTFRDNIFDISFANKKFKTWITRIRELKKDFKYVCVPEFQKRGAVHYHLLTNLSIKEDTNIISLQKGEKNMYDVRHWNYGFASVFDLKGFNVVGYISKYMTKDIDNRLYGHRRYLYSSNLAKPIVEYLNLIDNERHINYFNDLIVDSEIKFSNTYYDKFDNQINFIEFVLENTHSYQPVISEKV